MALYYGQEYVGVLAQLQNCGVWHPDAALEAKGLASRWAEDLLEETKHELGKG